MFDSHGTVASSRIIYKNKTIKKRKTKDYETRIIRQTRSWSSKYYSSYPQTIYLLTIQYLTDPKATFDRIVKVSLHKRNPDRTWFIIGIDFMNLESAESANLSAGSIGQ